MNPIEWCTNNLDMAVLIYVACFVAAVPTVRRITKTWEGGGYTDDRPIQHFFVTVLLLAAPVTIVLYWVLWRGVRLIGNMGLPDAAKYKDKDNSK